MLASFFSAELTEHLTLLGIGNESLTTLERVVWIVGIALVAYLVDLVCRKVFVPITKRMVLATQVKWDDYLLSDDVLHSICHIVPSIVVYVMLPFAFHDVPTWLAFLNKISLVYITATTLQLITCFLTGISNYTVQNARLKNHPIRGIIQMVKILVIFCGVLGIIAILINKSLFTLLAGLGAAATILMLVFKDTIVGLVAGVQLSANDMLRPGDWITMEKAGVDGDVIEVTLTTIKVRNFDKTIVTIPPYTLVSESFQNWRGMVETGGRRVKRNLNIDMTTIRFCTAEEVATYKEKGWIAEEAEAAEVTNIMVFRNFLEQYLRTRRGIHRELLIMVRQMEPTATGLPLQIYFFSDGTDWVTYEHLQSDVFSHIIATLPQFDLHVFQHPTGNDLSSLRNNPLHIESL